MSTPLDDVKALQSSVAHGNGISLDHEHAQAVIDAIVELGARRDQWVRVLAIHARDRRGDCKGCDGWDGEHGGRTVRWPCPTVHALDGGA